LKIALVVPGGVDSSGEVRVIPALLALIGRLAAEHDVHVFATHQDPVRGEWLLEGAHIHNLGLPRRAWRTAKAIVAEHRQRPFHIVHAFWIGQHAAAAVGAAALLRIPSLVHVAGGELIAFPDIAYGGCRTWRGRVLVNAVLRRAGMVTCASTPIVELIAKAAGVEAQRLPLGVDLQRWPPRTPSRRRANEPARFVHIASLNAVKDQPTLLRALHILANAGRDFHLDVIGEDTLGGSIQALAEELGLAERVTFHGFLTQRAMRPIVEAAHVSLITSRHETGPVVLLEAALAGVPTAGTAVGHIAEWSPHAALGVPCQDPAALAAALAAVLDDEDLRTRLADAASRRAQHEDADATARAFGAAYRQLMQRR
jgi:glycosyltransferase involved in cell wall biosynthesis